MKLYIMKREALELLKSNLPQEYAKYYTESDNGWIKELYGDNPFEEFTDISEFTLANLGIGLKPGEIDLENCKIIYKNLQFLSESQASDERVWAGLSHTVFYNYMRKRWGYGSGKTPKEAKREAGEIKTRFFYSSSGRSGFYRNTLAKCWWVGHNLYDSNNIKNPFEKLDIIGSSDINSKINEFFHNFSFSSNPVIMSAIVESLRHYRQENKYLSVRNHIRPALTKLNAVGGSMVLDCVEPSRITEIFTDIVDGILQGDPPILMEYEFESDGEVEEEDKNVDFSSQVSKDAELQEVVEGSIVTIKDAGGEIKKYECKKHSGKLNEMAKVLLGHKVGDSVLFGQDVWKVIKVTL